MINKVLKMIQSIKLYFIPIYIILFIFAARTYSVLRTVVIMKANLTLRTTGLIRSVSLQLIFEAQTKINVDASKTEQFQYQVF